jgi:dihydrofolate reductase
MTISLIVALADNGVIGRANQLPWRIPADLKHFKEVTLGRAVIMGRKTYESIGKPLPGRRNIVVSRKAEEQPGVVVCRSLEEAFEHCRKTEGDDAEVFVIGGSEIYRQAMPFADRLYLTRVHAQVEGDAFFPQFNESEYRELSREKHSGASAGDAFFTFLTLERKSK